MYTFKITNDYNERREVKLSEYLESHGIWIFQNACLEIVENQFYSWKLKFYMNKILIISHLIVMTKNIDNSKYFCMKNVESYFLYTVVWRFDRCFHWIFDLYVPIFRTWIFLKIGHFTWDKVYDDTVFCYWLKILSECRLTVSAVNYQLLEYC